MLWHEVDWNFESHDMSLDTYYFGMTLFTNTYQDLDFIKIQNDENTGWASVAKYCVIRQSYSRTVLL